ncbi:MAG TPA: sulfatase-like hydrolase/transferase [Polyangiaceae bacterium]
MAEVLIVLAVQHRRVASIWEGETGLLWLSPTLLAAALPFGALAWSFDWLVRSERIAARAGFVALVAGFAFAVGWGVGGGRHLASFGARFGFALLLAVCAAGGGFYAGVPLRRALAARPRVVAGLFALGVLVVEVVNQVVLVRLYPAFHLGLAALALTLGPLALLALLPPGPRRMDPAWALVPVFGAALACAVPASARRLAHFDNFRLLLLEAAPIGAQAVELAARVAPPPPWEDEPCRDPASCFEPGAAVRRERTLDLGGRDILLVTIDALRADHVGAYGYARPTTPTLDRLAREGTRFQYAYTPTPHTSYAITSLMTGKYMRPLLLQGMAGDSDTWAGLLRTYGYRTAAFYPPAVFFIDGARFERFSGSALDFEYRWVEFAEGDRRVAQVESYLGAAPPDRRLFAWVHLFGPHEPYEAHPEHAFGDRDIDRYDAEVAAADATLGRIVKAFVAARPRAAVFVTADHGEEFGDHGGRYHGTSVYEEQVRVPLVAWAPGAIAARVVKEPVELVDLLPTVLGALDIPRPPRLRGRDLGPLLSGRASDTAGFAYAETDEQALLASGSLRLVCARRLGACQLFDIAADPGQKRDLSGTQAGEREALKARLRELSASHGRYELGGLRAEGKGWLAAIRRALAGDGETAPELGELLDDADLAVRRKAAEMLFELKRPESAAALRLSLGREEDAETRAWTALALTRLGQGAPFVAELLDGGDQRFRRLAALALAEAGDRRGEAVLVEWWKDAAGRDFERSRQILTVLGELKVEDALWPLLQSLGDVRLRPYIARTLARIGEESARGPLLRAFSEERLQSTRVALAEALVDLGAKEELAAPFRRFLGVPDPLPSGLGLATRAKILEYVGGPKGSELARLGRHAELGQAVELVVPPGGNGKGVRVLVRARSAGQGEVVVSSGAHLVRFDREGKPKRQRGVPRLDEARALRIEVPRSDTPVELSAVAPASLGLRPGGSVEIVVYASTGVTLEAIACVPLADELPPPAPEPWNAGQKQGP